MFNERKLAKIVDIVTGSKTQETKSKKAKDKTLCPVKITGSEKSGNVYLYSWEGIKKDGTFDANIGKSGTDTKAIASCEIGKTISQPTYHTGDTCMLRRSGRGCILVSGGSGTDDPGVLSPVLDLTDEDNDGFGWEDGKKTVDGEQTGNETAVKFRFLQRMEYDPEEDQNFEYYRELTIDSKGKLRISGVIQEVGGFETTQHPDE